jgi:hypothetical protein
VVDAFSNAGMVHGLAMYPGAANEANDRNP